MTRYISKTARDRHIVSIKVECEVVCALLNPDIADDLEWEISAYISETVQDKYQWMTNRKSHVFYRIAPISMTLSDVECHFSCFKNF